MDVLDAEARRRDEVAGRILDFVRRGEAIKLPELGAESEFCGTIGRLRYCFDGEEDLLHLAIEGLDGGDVTPSEGREVAAYLLREVPPGLVWFRPGRFSQHFYCGHDDLLVSLRVG